MHTIKLHDLEFVPYIGNEEIEKAIDRVSERINADFKGAEDVPLIICVLNGSIMFTAELMKRLDFVCELASIRCSSYNGLESTGKINITGLTADVKDRRIIIVEDIVDTGATILSLYETFRSMGAKEIKICTMLLKPAVYRGVLQPDYTAMEVKPEFLVGFGLDYNQIGRNLKDIYILKK